MFEPLPDDIRAAIDTARPSLGAFGEIYFREEVESTNDLALTLASAGRPEGVSVLADVQTLGRGRRGRSWFSPAGAGLYLSVIVRPRMESGALPLVTLAAGVAMAEAASAVSRLPVALKWPNDLVIGRPWRKLGGVLAEAVASGARIDAVVVGMGINLTRASYPPDIAGRATSLETELGRPVDRAAMLVALLERLGGIMSRVHADDRQGIVRAWRQFGGAALDRTTVRWHDDRGEQRGAVLDVADDGALLVEVGGRTERVIAGEVVWETWQRD